MATCTERPKRVPAFVFDKVFFPNLEGSLAGRVRHVLGRFPRPPHRWCHLRPFRRQAGPQEDSNITQIIVQPFGAVMATGMSSLSKAVTLMLLRLQARIVAVEPVGADGIELTRAFTFEIEGVSKPACVAESLTRFYP